MNTIYTLPTVLVYAPEQWGYVDKFAKFYSTTFELSNTGRRCVSGVGGHFHKAITLLNLAKKLVPNLELDEQELKEKGFSTAENASELSAVVESIILELYSSLDCCRKIITEICSGHWKIQGVPDSTRKLFQKANKGQLVAAFPEQILNAILEADWYTRFLMIRDELTHQDIGRCHKDRKTGVISYSHVGVREQGRTLQIDDVFGYLDDLISGVNLFLGKSLAYFFSQLKDEPTFQICVFFQGRAYGRLVSPSELGDFHGGVCQFKDAMKSEENPNCPFMTECGAYDRA